MTEPAAAAPTVHYSSLGGRALAAVLDSFTLVGCYWLLGAIVASRVGGTTAGGFAVQGAPALVIMGGSMAAWLVFYICFEWLFGATPGKWAAGLRVTGMDGARPSPVQAVVRNVARIVDGFAVYLVGAIFVLVSKKRQRLGDLIARTVVVKRQTNLVLRVAAVVLAFALPVGAVAATTYLGLASASLSSIASTATPIAQAAGAASATTSDTAASSQPAAPGAAASSGGAAVTSFSDGPLTMGEVRLAASKDGPERTNRIFKPGEAVVILFSLSGMGPDASSGAAAATGHTRMKARVLDPFQAEVLEPMEHEDRLPTKEPVPSWLQFALPEYCLPGPHRIEIVLEDLVAKRRLEASVPFTVEAAPYEPSDTLVVQALRLTEGDHGAPRASASYPRGATVWMAMQAVGFKVGSQGAVKLRMDITVTRQGGESVGDLHLLTVDDKFFYAPKRIPMTANLTLGQLAPGQYTATVRASDDVGQQKAEQAVSFTISQ